VKVFVDTTRCTVSAQCAFAAEEVFALDEDDTLVYDPEPGEQWRDEVELAARSCPVQAILLDDDRP
jgi:ferredoxin